jgi:hypothetical protein
VRFALLVATVSLTLLCGSLMATEYRSAIFYRSPAEAQIQSLASGGPSMGTLSSWRARKEALTACAGIRSSFSFRLLPETSGRQVEGSCRALAEEILKSAPTTGLAHLVLLQGANDSVSRSRQLVLAQAMAPLEAMQLKLRTQTALEDFDTLSDDALLAAHVDLAFLLSTPWGRSWLSAAYLEGEKERLIIADVLATVPGADQRAFLAVLERSASEARSNQPMEP